MFDVANAASFAAQLQACEQRWGADLFEVLFGSDDGLWQRVLRAVHAIAPGDPAPTPNARRRRPRRTPDRAAVVPSQSSDGTGGEGT